MDVTYISQDVPDVKMVDASTPDKTRHQTKRSGREADEKTFFKRIRTRMDSEILSEHHVRLVTSWLEEKKMGELLYRASTHGFRSSDFHRHCDERGPTLIIIHTTNDSLFGEVRPRFTITLTLRGVAPQKYPQGKSFIQGSSCYGPFFQSEVPNLKICDTCNEERSYVRFKHEYGSFLGSFHFVVRDMEVYHIHP
ncbi:hypothetical protein PROFUN_05092 [Planoprotostelium fungivorum]|uniref:TLDc domain-containing protein n=1 Tax=Planoprotostelium fungivorum TaxID=1890364 RepID=A0A2P6NRM0_9EUKA|nr:hypothetical protein PROFUN_05092 [Planoprotostelium fungivorum]